MPWYEYVSEDGKETVTRHRPVDRRDDPVSIHGKSFRRRQIAGRVSVIMGAKPETQGQGVLRSYYKQEQKHGSRFRSEFSKDQIKKAWADEIP